ncbi:FACT complex subunit POB3 [Sugiyamaella lignohabitans]|uniref:FACT complex subunit POB3 n=1 Tax=Sugiyamaella lignohabitans TaxID=796027 RepID=A0A167DAP8_9ASCO|nr:FACT complex subunit POB3 [Sugiyamaella lignohabitans]ANB12685.1 FACT complex subunit POB3 [Sugiyamaella lignohabitans]
MAESGLGWKVSDKSLQQGGSSIKLLSEPFLLPSEEVQGAYWSRGARGYEIRVQTKNKGVLQLDGFDSDDFNGLKSALKNLFSVNLEAREHSLRGWNWGNSDFERSELVFNVANRPAFELPYSDVSNSNIIGKTEVAVEFNLQASGERIKGGDELVEIRFHVPGTVTIKSEDDDDDKKKEQREKKEKEREKRRQERKEQKEKERAIKKENGEEVEEEEESESESDSASGDEEQSAAQVFYESLKDRADIGQVAGEAIVSFVDILFLTPRGRYDIDMYPTSFRLRGKTYDYKIPYKNIQRLFLLPKPDDTHNIIVIQLDPPLRQGQTRYPFLVIQFLREEEIEVELNLEEKEFQEKYADKLKKSYDEAAHQVVGQLFKGLSGCKVVFPGSFTSSHGQAAVSCSLKASEGYLYCLEKSFMFVPKPTVYIPMSEISFITFSRVGGADGAGYSSSRTFDMSITLKNNGGEHQFSNIDREEQQGLEHFIKSKSIKLKNDVASEQVLLKAALQDDDSDSDVEMADRGSADEDEESVDEDFEAEDESDVAEEFDSNAESSSGEEDEDASGGESDNGPALKKART